MVSGYGETTLQWILSTELRESLQVMVMRSVSKGMHHLGTGMRLNVLTKEDIFVKNQKSIKTVLTEKPPERKGEEKDEEVSGSSTKVTWLVIILVILILAGSGSAAYFYVKKKKQDHFLPIVTRMSDTKESVDNQEQDEHAVA
ncbi:unnamed protein product [Lepidochelys olivacea]